MLTRFFVAFSFFTITYWRVRVTQHPLQRASFMHEYNSIGCNRSGSVNCLAKGLEIILQLFCYCSLEIKKTFFVINIFHSVLILSFLSVCLVPLSLVLQQYLLTDRSCRPLVYLMSLF